MADGALSLTKHYVFHRLVDEVGAVRAGMTVAQVEGCLKTPHVELADDLFQYDPYGRVVDSVLIQACRDRSPGAVRVLWAALVAADPRLRAAIRELTDGDGRIVADDFSTDRVQLVLGAVAETDTRKAASNLAHYFEQSRLLTPRRHGSQIVGVDAFLDTRSAVPLTVAHLATIRGWTDPLAAALDAEVNSWLNLSPEQFAEAWNNPASAWATAPTGASNDEPAPPPPDTEPGLDLPYVEADESVALDYSEDWEFNPDALENASRLHRATQNALASWVRGQSLDPLRPDGDPLFDVGWWNGDHTRFNVAEVKSLSVANESRQVRLGLGQVLDYRHQLESNGVDAQAVIALSGAPQSDRWRELCGGVGVELTWPPFDHLG